MYTTVVIKGITFGLILKSKLCVMKSEDSTAKSFVLRSLESAEFNGYSYHYYDWRTWKSIDWYKGKLYNSYAIVVLDDADLYVQTLLRYIDKLKCYLIIVLSSTNASIILRNNKLAECYYVDSSDVKLMVMRVPRSCVYCGNVFPASQLTTEHIIPQKFCDMYMPGAPIKEHYGNRVRACFACNRNKSDDILIPVYNKTGWMRFMTEEQIGRYSDIFVSLLNAQYENVVNWIFVKNMQSHVKKRLDYKECREIIENQISYFLRRYLERKPGEYWRLI